MLALLTIVSADRISLHDTVLCQRWGDLDAGDEREEHPAESELPSFEDEGPALWATHDTMAEGVHESV
jgi:hypothetical protein